MNHTPQEYKSRLNEIYKLSSILINDNVEKQNSLNDILKAACTLLNLELGVICLIKDNKYTFNEYYSLSNQIFDKNESIDVKNTLCDETLKKDALLAINNIANSDYSKNFSHQKNNVNCYIGTPIKYNDGEVGTLNFSSTKPKEKEFSVADIDLVHYLGQWVSHYLDRQYYKDSLYNKNLELEKLNIELEKKNDDLENIMEEKNQLLQILVHDLKSPLSNIKMLSYLFQEFATNEESEELIGIFNKSLEYVFHLIEQMETLNSVENFPLNVYIEEFNLDGFIKETVKSFSSIAEAKSIKIFYTAKSKEEIIKTDLNFLKRVLYNVISNAVKFSPFQKNINVDLEFVKNNFLIKIKDEGPGISEEDQKKLFDKFNKLRNKPTNNESSSGLGLFIVKELLKNLKGQIDVESVVDLGTTFIITLPKSLIDKT
ncbi:hypothetical protein A5893_06575 [Pedobacter psychrophilus]|uniref:histidine kinase n=1 Tax=Pedobacter psychrophilus TaxID=1826909 RepID=A0A179DJK2_9SPHI|nr:GAF domain-containing sensor histidine kinase [Pedobacter psychrophilus]OAQ40603.1 hypothetical protein A5893_06575 [Pedobacter psychrophilus]